MREANSGPGAHIPNRGNWKSLVRLGFYQRSRVCGRFTFGLPEVIADSYTAVTVRTLNNELIEVVYRDENFEVYVRKRKGEGQDISGDYNKYETRTEKNCNGATMITYHNSNHDAMKQLISYNGYSWSLVAPNGYWGDSNRDFVGKILEQ